MSTTDPLEYFLGVSREDGHQAILGLDDGPFDEENINVAVRTRLRAINDHPHGKHPRADGARKAVMMSAIVLRAALREQRNPTNDESPVVATPVPPAGIQPPAVEAPKKTLVTPVPPSVNITAEHLTPFDRTVLAVLLAGGGWNPRTQVIISGLAAQVGFDARNLHRVVLGLSRFIREGGSVATVESAGELRNFSTSLPLPVPGRIESMVSTVGEGLAREVRGDNLGSLARIIALFTLLALLGVGGLAWILKTPGSVEDRVAIRREVAEENVARAMEQERETSSKSVVVDGRSPSSPEVVRAKYRSPPNFKASVKPAAAITHLEHVRESFVDLDEIARRLETSPTILAVSRLEQWRHVIEAASGAWPLMDDVYADRFRAEVVYVLTKATDTSVARRLMGVFDVNPAGAVSEPLDVWRRAFKGGMLALIASRADMPLEVRSYATDLLNERMGAASLGVNARRGPFAFGAGVILDDMIEPLVTSTGIMGDSFDVLEAWELWLVANATVRNDSLQQDGILKAVRSVLASSRNISIDGEPANLMGRLIGEIDWGPRGPDPLSLQDTYLTWLEDSEISSISFWAFASLLDLSMKAPWYRSDCIPSPEGEMPARRGTFAMVSGLWPEPVIDIARGNRVLIPAEVLNDFDEILLASIQMSDGARTPVERMEYLVFSARLAQVGSLLVAERIEEAMSLLEMCRQQVDGKGTGTVPREELIGKARGMTDGVWASSFKNNAGNGDSRLKQLERLRAMVVAGGDLGPRDGEVFVEQVWRGSPVEVRSAARTIALQEFRNGPSVLQELLDTADRASLNEDTVTFIENLTGEDLPAHNTPNIEIYMRKALVRRLLELRDPDRTMLDRLTIPLRSALHARLKVIGPTRSDSGSMSLKDISRATTDAMRDVAQQRLFADPFPASLDVLEKTRTGRVWLTQGSPQRLVAEFIGELDFLAYIVAADVPSERMAITRIRSDNAREREQSRSALLQAGIVLRGISELERLRLGPKTTDPLGGSS